MVKVRHSEGVAIHTDPESCAGYCREAAREALTGLRVSRDREHGFHCIVSKYFAGS